MQKLDSKLTRHILNQLNIQTNVRWNLSPSDIEQICLEENSAKKTNLGALAVDTGKFTGRAPKDRYIVNDSETKNTVWWGNINQPFSEENFRKIRDKIILHLNKKDKIYARNCFACANKKYRLNITLISESAWASLFGYNMFIRPNEEELENFKNEWTIICAPSFEAAPKKDGTKKGNFSIISFKEKQIIIGGTAYTGEIKKGVFSVLNFLLPHKNNVLAMHCSANIGIKNDTALFFGLSGTGKTTLSAHKERKLIGDDEHGWDEKSIFNFEGGCYAKCIDLSFDKEPDIYSAVKQGALLENICFKNNDEIDFSASSKTENTRVSYPIHYIKNIAIPSVGSIPKNIFFLTADAFGVLPPVSKLNSKQAMFHFISGYTAKVAGTEEGITEPEATFSACFGAPFMPLHPTVYAKMLSQKMKKENVNVWLINTGWVSGAYGIGHRIKLAYTRAIIEAALNGDLHHVNYESDQVFGLNIPLSCPNVPSEILKPWNTWKNKNLYKKQAQKLALLFNKNFEKFNTLAEKEILLGGPIFRS